MSKSDFPSIVSISSQKNGRTVFEFLCSTFPKIAEAVWQDRIESRKVHYENGEYVSINDIAVPNTRIFYYKEVEHEEVIPFKEKILFSDSHIIVADKPHFLPVTPAGRYVNETLLSRLKKSTGLDDITPVNRLDRETAGLVLFSINRESRDSYYNLFRQRMVYKSYKAVSIENPDAEGENWRIENRLIQGEPWFRMKISGIDDDPVNAVTGIQLDKCSNGLCHFSLHPETGQKHQLRVHMALIGYPILNDRFYPFLYPEEDDFSKPLKLLAEKLGFKDPVSGNNYEFQTELSIS